MKTEITRDRLCEFFPATLSFENNEGVFLDYAEIEIEPEGIKKLEQNINRCGKASEWSEEEWSKLNDRNSLVFEHIVAYVDFYIGTNKLYDLCLSVRSVECEDFLDVDKLINKEEKQNLIEAALESIHERRTEYENKGLC